MDQEKKRCMVCAKLMPSLKGGICEPCQERIRREAMGEQKGLHTQAEKELKKHGVTPDSGSKKN